MLQCSLVTAEPLCTFSSLSVLIDCFFNCLINRYSTKWLVSPICAVNPPFSVDSWISGCSVGRLTISKQHVEIICHNCCYPRQSTRVSFQEWQLPATFKWCPEEVQQNFSHINIRHPKGRQVTIFTEKILQVFPNIYQQLQQAGGYT